MSGVRIVAAGGARITVEDGAVRRAFGDLSALGSDLTPLMREVGDRLVASTKLRFEDGVEPGGAPWRPSIRAKTGAGQTLRDTGRLMASITRVAEPRRVIVGTNTRYAAVHQFGSTIRAKTAKGLRFKIGNRFVVRRQVTIPARPFLGVSAADVAALQRIVERRVADAIRGRPSA